MKYFGQNQACAAADSNFAGEIVHIEPDDKGVAEILAYVGIDALGGKDFDKYDMSQRVAQMIMH